MGEGEYNLNSLKQTHVTESFLGLNQDVRGCQNSVSILECQTKQYTTDTMDKCGCLPMHHRVLGANVSLRVFISINISK